MTEIASDRIGTSVLFENDRVRVWEMALEPGTSSAFHQHHYDYVVIYTGDSELEIAFDGQEPYRRSFDSGYVGYFVVGAVGTPHRITNVDDEPHHHFIVELLGPSASDRELLPIENERVHR